MSQQHTAPCLYQGLSFTFRDPEDVGCGCTTADPSKSSGEQRQNVAVITLTLPFTGAEDWAQSDHVREALENLAAVMQVQAEDGLYTGGSPDAATDDNEWLADFGQKGWDVAVKVFTF